MGGESNGNGWKSALWLIPALLVIDAALTFENVWPTPAIRWTGELSVELAVAVLSMAVAVHWFGGARPGGPPWVAPLRGLPGVGPHSRGPPPAPFCPPNHPFFGHPRPTHTGGS